MAERRGLGRLPGGGTRWRITLAVAGLAAVLLSAMAWITVAVVEEGQRTQVQLQAMQDLTSALTLLSACQLPQVDGTSLPIEVSSGDRVLASSPLFAPHEQAGPILPVSASPLALQTDGHGNLSSFSTSVTFGHTVNANDLDGRTVRVQYADLAVPAKCTEALGTGESGTVRILVAQFDYQSDEVLRPVRQVLWWAVPVAVVVVALAAWLSVGWSLRPVERMRRRLSGISSSHGDRVAVPPTGDELAALAVSVNDALDRIEDADARQRQFIGDAAHELRSPVASLRSAVEVAMLYPDPEGRDETLAAVDRQSRRLAALVESLLVLERLGEGGTRPVGSCDLAAVVIGELEVRREGPVPVAQLEDGLPPVRGSADDLARLVANLLDNAARHATSRVEVRLAGVGDGVELVVSNDGPVIEEADRERIFERLVRLDSSRTQATGGTGLGLSIVSGVARRVGGTVRATEREGLTAFVVTVPAAADRT